MKNKLLHFLLAATFLLLSPDVLAQGDSEEEGEREAYIQEFPDKFYLKPILTVRNLELKMRDRSSDNGSIVYQPSTNTYFGLGLYMFKLGFEVSFRLPVNEKDITRYGKSSIFDFQSNIYSKRWGADIAFQDYEGFYVKNPATFFPSWNKSQPYPQRSDLEALNFQINGVYIFNYKKFSYRSSFMQADKQLKSAGSLLLGASLGIFKFDSDSTLIPQRPGTAPSEGMVEAGKFTFLGLLPGYTHNFIIKDFYMNLSFSAGPAQVWTRFKTDEGSFKDGKVRPIISVRGALGYNSQRFFCGFSVVSQSISYDVNNLDINGQSGNAKLFLGYRFQEKGVMAKRLF